MTENLQPETNHISEAQLHANRANAQLSCGPVTSEGKAKSSRNALKTGLAGATVLLPSDDPEQYRLHIERHVDQLQPIGELECQLVQRIADAQWRLNRIPVLERNIYKLARREFAGLFEEESDQDRADLIQAHTYITYKKEFQNLILQETRIRRGYERDVDELKSLQSQRGKLEENNDLLRKWPAPWPGGRKNGFEFSKDEQQQQRANNQLVIGTFCQCDPNHCIAGKIASNGVEEPFTGDLE